MTKSELKDLIKETLADLVFEGKKTFGQLSIGTKFKLPNDYEDVTLQKVKNAKYKALGGSGKGMESNSHQHPILRLHRSP